MRFYVNGEELVSWSGVIDFSGFDPSSADGSLLTIDDGTDRNQSVTFEFDNNGVVVGATPLAGKP